MKMISYMSPGGEIKSSVGERLAIMQTMILTPFFKLTPLEKGKVEI